MKKKKKSFIHKKGKRVFVLKKKFLTSLTDPTPSWSIYLIKIKIKISNKIFIHTLHPPTSPSCLSTFKDPPYPLVDNIPLFF